MNLNEEISGHGNTESNRTEITYNDNDLWEYITDKITEEQCVLIIGPNISLKSPGKTINDQLNEIFDHSGLEHKFYQDDGFFSFPDRGNKGWAYTTVRKFFSSLEPNNIHKLITEIPFHLIVSLSPDTILKNYFHSENIPFSNDFYEKGQNPKDIKKPTKKKPLIYNLFGSYDVETSLILTYDDIFDYLLSVFHNFELPNSLKIELQSPKLVLFLGIQYEKWYFKLLLSLLKLKDALNIHAGKKDSKIEPQTENFYSDEIKVKFLDYSEEEILHKIYQKCQEKKVLRQKNTNNSEIFISYAWNDESQVIVDKIYHIFKDEGYNIHLDKVDIGFKGNIRQYMQTIGKGKYIIVIISDKYLKSPNCMYEMLEIKEKGNVSDKIFPIILRDANIYDEEKRIDYLNFWDEKIESLNKKIKEMHIAAGIKNFINTLDQYCKIRSIMDEITEMLQGMNTLTPEMHRENNFEILFRKIEEKIKADNS